jgi:hypothetical protein
LAAAGLFVLGAGLLIGGGVSFYLSDGSEPSHEEPSNGGLSAAGVEAINRYCSENQSIIEQMPKHTRTREVLDYIAGVWARDAGVDRQAALEAMAKAFNNSPLGLAALNERLSSGAANTERLCRDLVDTQPDSRVACMALDRLVQSLPDGGQGFLDAVTTARAGTRVGAFALAVKGDRARDAGDMKGAARCWLEAWIADPKRAKPLYDNLSLYWMQSGDWYYPLLLPAAFREDAVLTPVKQHALAALLNEGTGASLLAPLREAGKALQSGDVEGAVALIDQLVAGGAAVTAEDKALLGTAVYLIGAEKDYTITLDLASSLKARRVLTQCRERALAWAREGLASLPRELQACYALQVARRRLGGLSYHGRLSTHNVYSVL